MAGKKLKATPEESPVINPRALTGQPLADRNQAPTSDYVLSVRKRDSAGNYLPEVGEATFLIVPATSLVTDGIAGIDSGAWFSNVIASGTWQNAAGEQRGDILFIVHGYNMDQSEVLDRHRRIKADLLYFGYKGTIVSYDWPSDNKTLAYWEDRHRAMQTAMQLVSNGIAVLSERQTPQCAVNVHVLGHSTGAYVIREGFSDADNTALPSQSWMTSQLVFIAGDVSADSMVPGNDTSSSIYRHCVRFTNYSNRHDMALDVSNVKRIGVAPRVGRVGLPDDLPAKAVNVDCSDYYMNWAGDAGKMAVDSPQVPPFVGMQSHSWYFGNRVFAQDLFNVIIGIDRYMNPRRTLEDGNLKLA